MIIAIAAFILVMAFAVTTVQSTEAALNNIEPTGMASLEETKTDYEPILVKEGAILQLKKLKLKNQLATKP